MLKPNGNGQFRNGRLLYLHNSLITFEVACQVDDLNDVAGNTIHTIISTDILALRCLPSFSNRNN